MKPENKGHESFTDFQRGYYFGLKEALSLEKPEIAQIVRSYESAGITITDEERLTVRLKETPYHLASVRCQRAMRSTTPSKERSERKTIAYDPYFPLAISSQEEDHVIQLQTVLKRLGYYDTRIDGKFGRGTKRAIQAFQFDADLEPTGVVEKATAGKLESLLYDETRWIIPMRNEVSTPQDQMALFVDIMAEKGIPLAYALAVAEQEGNMDHFDSDGFVKLRIEFWGQYNRGDHPDYQIRYRSYGMLQILDMGNPDDSYTRGDEVGGITNRELKESVAKNIEAGACLLRSLLRGDKCQYPQGDDRWYACKACVQSVTTMPKDWTNTVEGVVERIAPRHRWKCNAVPDFEQIPCSWPEAIRRYNGSGNEAFAYRDELLTRIVGAKRTYV